MLSTKRRLPDPAAGDLEPINQNPQYRAGLGELEALESRQAETEERRKRALARGRGVPPGRSVVERARDLVGSPCHRRNMIGWPGFAH